MARLQPYLPKSCGKPRVDERRVLSGIVFVSRNGCAGVMRPARVAIDPVEAMGERACSRG